MYKIIFFILFIINPFISTAQNNIKQKKLISAIEIFAGPNASFNYGNKFIENYEDENVTNKRLWKIGYAAGIGVYHPVSNRLDLNVRLQYETKGTKNELNVPLNPVNDDTRVFITSEYTYHYITASVIPQISIGKQQKFKIGIGAYYSKIRKVKGYEKELFEREDIEDTEVYFEGRIFRDLREDGAVKGGAISRGLFRMNKYDYGSIFFISYAFNINHTFLNIELQHQLGLQNINFDNPYNLEEKNNTFQFSIGYYLPLKPNK